MKKIETLVSAGILVAAFCLVAVLLICRGAKGIETAAGEGPIYDGVTPAEISDAFSESDSPPPESSADEASQPSDPAVSEVQSEVSSQQSPIKSEQPKILPEPEPSPDRIVDYTLPSSYSVVQNQIDRLCAAFPELVSRSSIGSSVQGRDITFLKVGRGSRKICLVGAMHAREHITSAFLMRCVEDYASAYYSDSGSLGRYDVKGILDDVTFYVVPNCNPDGTEIILSGETPAVDVIRTKASNYKANANGVNLNRNFPFAFGFYDKMSDRPHEEKFPGYSEASEPETKALMELCLANDFEKLVSFHIQGECVYWADSINIDTANSEQLADRLKNEFDFYKCPVSSDLSLYGGGFENWFRYNFSRPGLCVELMPLEYKASPLSDFDNRHMESSVRYSVTRDIPLVIAG